MTDQSTPSGTPADRPDPSLDETQPVEIRRYEPTPERPGGWTTGSTWNTPPSSSRGPDRWYEAAPAAVSTPVTPVQPHPVARRGVGFGPVVLASVLSAVLASGGTIAILSETGALGRPAASTLPTGTQTSSSQPGQPVTIDESSAIIDASARVSPAVVRITVQGAGNFDGTTVPSTGVGSGVIYSPDGWIVTNKHVVQGGDKLTVELKDGREFEGRVYGIDTLTDLAVVKVDARQLPSAELGSADGLKIGQLVIAIGSPLGTYSFSVTSGIVSGKGRSIGVDNGERLTNLIQTDAAINPGNSGGPLVDAGGTIVGINTAIASDANGIGFAIPIDIARPILEQALRGDELARPWIGIRFTSVDLQIQESNDLPVDHGAWVTTNGQGGEAIIANSPAASAGLKDDDIITAIEGTAVDQEHPLDALLVRYPPGTTITLTVMRGGQPVDLDVTLGTRPDNLG